VSAGAERVNLGKNGDARAKHSIVPLVQPHIRLEKDNTPTLSGCHETYLLTLKYIGNHEVQIAFATLSPGATTNALNVPCLFVLIASSRLPYPIFVTSQRTFMLAHRSNWKRMFVECLIIFSLQHARRNAPGCSRGNLRLSQKTKTPEPEAIHDITDGAKPKPPPPDRKLRNPQATPCAMCPGIEDIGECRVLVKL